MLTSDTTTKEEDVVQSAEISQTTTTNNNATMEVESDNNSRQEQQQDKPKEEEENTNHGDDIDTVKKKRNRSRKKKLYSEICKQMEFYFSDANISKNRTMENLIRKGEGYVGLNEFVNFNKIQKMTQDMDLIQMLQKSLKESETLELSQDMTKVKRKIPFDKKNLKSESELEACTIYIENIPLHFDQDKLKELFQEFGPISYVAIPKSKQTGLHKGFAFVEFENDKSARCCLKAYGDIGLCLPDTMNPQDLQSVKTFDRTESSIGDTESLSGKIGSSIDNYSLTVQKNKRKHFSGERNKNKDNDEQNQQEGNDTVVKEEKDDEIPKKKIKISVQQEQEQEQEILKEKDDNNSNDKSSNSEQQQQQQSVNMTEEIQVKHSNEDNNVKVSKKKKRRRNQKTKKIEDIEKCESESIQLRIMPKMSWRQLRNRYLNLQRKHLSDLKKLYRYQKQQQQGEEIVVDNNDDTDDVLEPYKSGPKKKMKKNKKKEVTIVKPSVLVKIGFSTPFPAQSENDLKEQLTNEIMPKEWSNALQFIDLATLPSHVIVKLNGNDDCIEAVSDFVQNAIPIYNDVEILSAEAAEEYWQLVRKNLKQKSTRGRDKIMQQAMKSNTHIRFDDTNSPESKTKEQESV